MRSKALASATMATVALAGSAGIYTLVATAGARPPGRHVTIKEKEFKLIPKTAHARKGRVTITVRNTGTIVHALEVEHGGARGSDVKTRRIRPGHTATLTLHLKRGHFEMYCPVDHHKQMGMKGTLVIVR
jgi:uncharacterized cupredoxin-like copper-binding protein